MALENAHSTRTVKGKAIQELQGLTKVLVAGAAAATDIAITGIKVTDTIKSVLHFTPSAAMADLTSEASITAAGVIQLSTTATTGDQLIVEYYIKPL